MGYRKKRFYDNEAVLNYILIDLKEEEYKDELVDMLIDKDTIELPNYLKNNREILDKCFEKKAWILAFSSNILNEQDFEKYFNAIMICFKIYKDNEINFNYQNSSKLLEVCLKKGEFKFIDYFSSNAFNSALLCAGNYDLFSDTVISRNITIIY